jgi:hypothetical protein
MKVREFEERVWDLEHIRIVIRADRNEEVEDYSYKNSASDSSRTSQFLRNRVESHIDGRGVTVIQGDGKIANGNLQLWALRESYSAE